MCPDTLFFPSRSSDDEEATLHRTLANFNRARFSPGFADGNWRHDLDEEARLKLLEGEFIEGERQSIHGELEGVPSNPSEFIAWFEGLYHSGRGQGDALFPWLSEHATRDQVLWFLHQEVAGEAGFDDLVALTQVRLPTRPKLELARNYWDEMGRGQAKGMHGPMLARLAKSLGLAPRPETTVWQSLALGNLMSGFAANRRYAYQSLGALGVIELTAPSRASYVAKALKRLGVEAKLRLYFELHAVLDVRHSEAWVREVLHPLATADSRAIPSLAEGALLRLRAGLRCFTRYREQFGIAGTDALKTSTTGQPRNG